MSVVFMRLKYIMVLRAGLLDTDLVVWRGAMRSRRADCPVCGCQWRGWRIRTIRGCSGRCIDWLTSVKSGAISVQNSVAGIPVLVAMPWRSAGSCPRRGRWRSQQTNQARPSASCMARARSPCWYGLDNRARSAASASDAP